MNEKTLILLPQKDFYGVSDIKLPNADILPCFKIPEGFPFRYLFKFCRRFPLPSLLKAFWRHWRMEINRYSKIIFFDSVFYGKNTIDIKYIRKKAPSTPIYVFIWNNMESLNSVRYGFAQNYKNIIAQSDVKVYSYYERDCTEYGFQFNPTFYDMSIKLPQREISYDVLFCGRLKNRDKKLSEMYHRLENENLRPYFHVIHRQSLSVKNDFPFEIYPPKHAIPYRKYLELVAESHCVLDIMNNDHTGFSLRVMEAICFDKKLITNNVSVKKTRFYNPANIYVLDGEDTRTFKEFLNEEFVAYLDDVRQYYSVEKWLSRFQ